MAIVGPGEPVNSDGNANRVASVSAGIEGYADKGAGIGSAAH